jgi:methylmalonyl-CoA mutase
MLRTTTEAFSAIVGGVDSLHSNTFNEITSAPDEFARRIARNTQIILKEEAHINHVIDPAGGSYYVEWLTHKIAKEVWKEFKKIEEKGGMFEALKAGCPQDEIEKIVGQRNKDIRKRKTVIVGINNYVNSKETFTKPKGKGDDRLYNKRSQYLKEFRVSGDQAGNKSIIEKLGKLVDTHSEELINLGSELFLAGATLGEITHAARAVSEESISTPSLRVHRMSELFEDLRAKSFKYEETTGAKPKIFLANIGTTKQYKTRADFSRAFFEVGGFEVINSMGYENIDAAVAAALKSGSQAVVICSTDDNYPVVVPQFCKGIKSKKENIILVLAGYPSDQVEDHKKSGIDDFIFLGCDAYEVLSSLHEAIRNLA